jgi:hypothetical protein
MVMTSDGVAGLATCASVGTAKGDIEQSTKAALLWRFKAEPRRIKKAMAGAQGR